MAIVTRNLLKSWFVTLAKPVQAQFHDWIDSFRHKSEKIGSADLDETLSNTINALPSAETIAQVLTELQDKATVAQFQALQLQVNNLSVLLEPVVLNLSAPGSYSIPQGKILTKVWAIPDAESTVFGIGNAEGISDLVEPEEIEANSYGLYTLDVPSMIDKIIHFNNITSAITIKLFII